MWPAVFYPLIMDEERYGRSIESFRPRPPQYNIATDSALKQVGVILYIKAESSEACIGGAAVSIMDFGFGKDSSFQNTTEYIGMVLGVLAIGKAGIRDGDVLIRGDSTAALAWITEGTMNGPLSH
jgi:hypothetical protein